jgi:hypothetical protein
VTLPIAIDTKGRLQHMAACLSLQPRPLPRGAERAGRLAVVCYGPSLADTWSSISGPMITVSGAHDYLIERGVVPDWHVEIDPRPHKIKMLTPNPAVQYALASVCHPDFWQHVLPCDPFYWHAAHDAPTSAWALANDPTGPLLSGGSVAGLAALSVGHYLGWRHFDVYGMDCSLRDGVRHAGPHTGGDQPLLRAVVGGMEYYSTPQLKQAAEELLTWRDEFELDLTIHGDGLLAAVIADMATR